MMYYVFFMIVALNFAGFMVSLLMYFRESLKAARYREIENYIRSLEIENLKSGERVEPIAG